jgi:hypothetical protein
MQLGFYYAFLIPHPLAAGSFILRRSALCPPNRWIVILKYLFPKNKTPPIQKMGFYNSTMAISTGVTVCFE